MQDDSAAFGDALAESITDAIRIHPIAHADHIYAFHADADGVTYSGLYSDHDPESCPDCKPVPHSYANGDTDY